MEDTLLLTKALRLTLLGDLYLKISIYIIFILFSVRDPKTFKNLAEPNSYLLKLVYTFLYHIIPDLYYIYLAD